MQVGHVLQYASADAQSGSQVVLEVVRGDGDALRDASADIPDDWVIVLKYASADSQGDAEATPCSTPRPRSKTTGT